MIEVIVFLLSFILSLLIVPVVIRIYQRHNWIDDPKSERHIKKTHRKPVPRGGGIPIFISFLVCAFLFLTIDKYLLAITIAALILTIVGVFDDIYDLHPYWRLIAGVIAGLIVVGSGIGIAYVSHPFQEGVIHLDTIKLNLELLGRTRELWIFADLFALVFILWNMNIVNWSKGLDGQLPAFVVVAFVFLGLLSDSFSSDPTQFNNALLSFILAGSFAGLLIYNWYPQKIMPGYGAGSLAGFFSEYFGSSFRSKSGNNTNGFSHSNRRCYLHNNSQTNNRKITNMGRSRPSSSSTPRQTWLGKKASGDILCHNQLNYGSVIVVFKYFWKDCCLDVIISSCLFSASLD